MMSERHEDESLKGPIVSGHGPVISKVDRYLKERVSELKQG
ncbi:protein of unknown function [Cyanobium sp. NIES-981]|nr:protein of unknown function [Cyanobium sp. NIES-981]SBO44780.1 protein of unknown function [Cyanobium sp. NIES-981]